MVHMATPCTTGWFGPDCQYRCRCTNNSCDVNGFCVNGSKCNVSWFGPKCQYQDLMFLRSYITPESVLVVDGDDTTCVYQNRFTVTWATYYEINWIRLIVSATSRNVALKQTTKQSEDYKWYGATFPSYLAVDGNNDTSVTRGSCSLTVSKGVWN
ncbi:uncharacterized protein LOC131953965, partial [Physella acuta]|uniref:uncharacterized protein LOC131953965 n=1 Tax=Physella acuta TaxID=109671 RepID=UPI0027DB915A